MKKTLLSLITVLSFSYSGIAQNLYAQSFDVTTAVLTSTAGAGWSQTNQSTPLGASTWSIPSTAPTATDAFGGLNRAGQAGGANSFILVNFNSTTGATGIISNWLITSAITVQNGDIVSFYTRKGTDQTGDYPDRLELRMSTDAITAVPSAGSSDVGSFTTLGVSVNPTLASGFVYPQVWTKYSYVVAGVPTPTAVKFGFRYFVTNAGPTGTNSDIIGIDTFSVDRTVASTSDFFSQNISMYPNPANGIVTLASKNATAINSVQVTDLNGRIVKSFEANGVSETKINVSDLTTGMYFVSVKTDAGSGSMKLMKN